VTRYEPPHIEDFGSVADHTFDDNNGCGGDNKLGVDPARLGCKLS
jgi:hypothetical protein